MELDPQEHQYLIRTMVLADQDLYAATMAYGQACRDEGEATARWLASLGTAESGAWHARLTEARQHSAAKFQTWNANFDAYNDAVRTLNDACRWPMLHTPTRPEGSPNA